MFTKLDPTNVNFLPICEFLITQGYHQSNDETKLIFATIFITNPNFGTTFFKTPNHFLQKFPNIYSMLQKYNWSDILPSFVDFIKSHGAELTNQISNYLCYKNDNQETALEFSFANKEWSYVDKLLDFKLNFNGEIGLDSFQLKANNNKHDLNGLSFKLETPLVLIAREPGSAYIMRKLIYWGEKLNLQEGSPIHAAVEVGDFEYLNLLMRYNASLNTLCRSARNYFFSPLDIALYKKYPLEEIKPLIQNTINDPKPLENKTYIINTCQNFIYKKSEESRKQMMIFYQALYKNI